MSHLCNSNSYEFVTSGDTISMLDTFPNSAILQSELSSEVGARNGSPTLELVGNNKDPNLGRMSTSQENGNNF